MLNKNYNSSYVVLFLLVSLSSCSFNFELTSQKTALENQIMGSYKELDDEVLQLASVRGVSTDGQVKEAKIQGDAAKLAQQAKQNQSFNRDDVDELKTLQLIGEAKTGQIITLPKGIGLYENAKEEDQSFAKYLIEQENRDRDIVVKRLVSTTASLSNKDLSEAQKVYRSSLLSESPEGTWYQTEEGTWERKSAAPPTK